MAAIVLVSYHLILQVLLNTSRGAWERSLETSQVLFVTSTMCSYQGKIRENNNLHVVLNNIREAGVTLNKEKCQFSVSKLYFLATL